MKIKLCIILLLIIGVNCCAQNKKLPDGWGRVLIKGKMVYKNLVTGDVSKRYPKKPALNPLDETDFDPTIVHIVKEGETLSIIAKKYSLDLVKLNQLNSISNIETIEIGKEIIIGYAHNELEKNAFLNGDINALNHDHDHGEGMYENNTQKEEKRAIFKYHTVLSGETLYRVALTYKLSVNKLKKLNDLKKATIFVGQKLRIK
ncbi:LysM peptidoglycan-binding domain-containing protein [uncultured Tenacibaculum sp.]|uniref:LysM peptidoglycan-binding domain-containing protein n=1 Tax=uncultured Tenacibaculum sp. TaxID=174713 RepID=UPI00260BFE00|nr:LysM peptidoglycan-binding domain-containing protein [uncultured Tenacibaculum sp.]